MIVSSTSLNLLMAAARRVTQATVEQELTGRAAGAPDGERVLATQYVAPRSAAERTLAAIWSEVLGIRTVGVEDDFFELGGNSLVAIQLVAMVRERLDVSLPMRSLFEAPTVAGMARLVGAASPSGGPR